MQKLYENIKKLRIEKKLSQSDLAKLTGYTDRSSIAKIEKGTVDLPQSKIKIFATVFGITPSELMGFDVPMKESSESIQSEKYPRSEGWIPVVGDVAAGLPIEAIEDILDYEQIDVKLLDSADYFGLRIKGKSMEPRIKEGDVVIVRVQPDVESGEVAIVKVNGDSATCKILKKYADMLVLLPLNPTFEPQEYTKEDVKTLPVQVIGKVVELRGKF